MKNQIIKFHDTEILAVERDGQWWVAVKPIIDAIGLNADSAVNRIKTHRILGQLHAVHRVVAADFKEREMLCLPTQQVHGWLFSIDINKVKPEIQDRLELFQRECYQVLFNHFYGKNKTINANIEERYRLSSYLKKLNRLIALLMKRHQEVSKEIKQLDNGTYVQLGLFNP